MVERAEAWAAALAPHVGCLKLGLEFFVANGPAAVARIARHAPLFLDLKFYDIPNTVAGPMAGFDAQAVSRAFFPDGRHRVFMVVNLGHPCEESYRPRQPRLAYDEVVTTV